MTTFADRLREAMAARDMGANELNRAMGKPMGFTSNLLTRTNPRMDTLSIVAQALHVRLQWLAEGTGPRDSTPLCDEIEREVGHLRSQGSQRHQRPHCFGDLPGWAPIEKEIRARGKYSQYTEDDWVSSRGTMGGKLPEHLTKDVVLHLVQMWHEIHEDEKEGKYAEHDADLDRRLVEAQERNREKKRLAAGAEGQASPPPPSATAKPKSGPQEKKS